MQTATCTHVTHFWLRESVYR